MIHVKFLRYLSQNPAAIILIFVGLWFLYIIRDIFAIVFLAFVFVSAFSNFVDFLQRKHVPRIAGILLIYLLMIIPVIVFNLYILPPLIMQSQAFAKDFPQFIGEILKGINLPTGIENYRNFISSRVDDIVMNAVSAVFAIFGGAFAVITFIFINIYWLLDHKKVHKSLSVIFPDREKASKILSNIESKLGAWARGQIVLSLGVAFMTWLALFLIGIPYAIPLAVLAGLVEFIPALGPTLGFIPVFIIAFTISPMTVAFVALAYIIIQIVEGNILVPKVMQRAVGLHPIVVLLSLILFTTLLGLVGALIAVPFLTMLTVMLSDLQKNYDKGRKSKA